MTCSDVEAMFDELCREVAHADDDHVEEVSIRLVSLIEEHAACRSLFVSLMNDLVLGKRPDVPWECVAFCIHKLRWPELRETIMSRLKDEHARNNWRAIPILGSYRDAFEDDWEDAVNFASLRKDNA